jgi:DNA-binding FadR family transcriptional regulator
MGMENKMFTPETIIANFEDIASAVYNSASSDKGREFAKKIADQIRAKGNDWIVENEMKLQISHDVQWHEQIAPVTDNRLYYLTQWQVALR